MDEFSTAVLALFALVGGALSGVVSLLLGGAGAIRQLNSRVRELEDFAEATDQRITREVKARAGRRSAEKRAEAPGQGDLLSEAESLLAGAQTAAGPAERPRVLPYQR